MPAGLFSWRCSRDALKARLSFCRSGFIRDAVTQENIFVHINDLEVEIKENDRVTYDVGKSFKGAVALRVRMKE